MGKVALITIVGPTDSDTSIDKSGYENTATVSFLRNNNKSDVSINAFLKELKKLKLEPSEIAMDLLVIACSMYGADTRISRNDYAEDSWTRIIDLYIPVSDLELWNSQKVLIEKIFRFLTGDIWKIIFRERADKNLLLSPKGNLKKYGMPYKTDTVCLFSGGMDSFIGAIDLLDKGITPLLLSHSKSADVSSYQVKCEKALVSEFPGIGIKRVDAYISIPKQKLLGEVENTERGRSFLFLSLGAICASTLGITSKLIVPENGLISLNIPLTPLRIGAHSTRTTHPHYFNLMKELFDGLGLGVTIMNPFQFKTKGEMLIDSTRKNLVVKTESMSCSHPSGRWHGLGNIHCGYCVPCIIRQASFLKAGLTDSNKYRIDIGAQKQLKISEAEGADFLAFQYMIEKNKRNANYLIASIRNTGPLGINVDSFVDVYNRGLKEVQELVKNIKLV